MAELLVLQQEHEAVLWHGRVIVGLGCDGAGGVPATPSTLLEVSCVCYQWLSPAWGQF